MLIKHNELCYSLPSDGADRDTFFGRMGLSGQERRCNHHLHECDYESGDECPVDAAVPAVDNRYTNVGGSTGHSSGIRYIFCALWTR